MYISRREKHNSVMDFIIVGAVRMEMKSNYKDILSFASSTVSSTSELGCIMCTLN